MEPGWFEDVSRIHRIVLKSHLKLGNIWLAASRATHDSPRTVVFGAGATVPAYDEHERFQIGMHSEGHIQGFAMPC